LNILFILWDKFIIYLSACANKIESFFRELLLAELLMRQFFAEIAINPGTGNRAEQRYDNNCCACSDLCKQRSRAGSGDGPTKTKDESTVNLAFVKLFFMVIIPIDLVFFNVEHIDLISGRFALI